MVLDTSAALVSPTGRMALDEVGVYLYFLQMLRIVITPKLIFSILHDFRAPLDAT